MPEVRVGNETLHYQAQRAPAAENEAALPPLLLVHGAGGTLMHWPAALRRLPGHTVYALDLPGHGHSSGRGRQTVAEYAATVAAFLEALNLGPAVVAGHSMGGAIAQELALRHGEHVAALVLVGTGARLRVAPQILTGLTTDLEGTTRLIASWAHGDEVPPAQLKLYARRLRAAGAETLYGDFAACDAFDARGEVSQIRVPTLVICGAEDRMMPLKFSQYLAEQIAGARLVVVPGAGHMVMLEQPAPVAQAVEDFVDHI